MTSLSAAARAAAVVVLSALSTSARTDSSQTAFLDFPLAIQTIAASKADAFAWLVRQGEQTHIRFAAAPDFKVRTAFSATDLDGQPITEIALSADGKWLVFATTWHFGEEEPHNPASLLEPPPPTLWALSTAEGATAQRIGPGVAPIFAPDGAQLLYRHGKDLHVAELGAEAVNDRILIRGGAAFSGIQWSPDGRALAFVHDRGAYAYLGLYRLGEDRLRWLVTEPDRVTAPVWSADGTQIAYLQLPGREHTKAYDLTESEPLSVNRVQVNTGQTSMLWQTTAHASGVHLEDADSALRWMGGDQLVFYSEHDGWGRLYALHASGGRHQAAGPQGCEMAESAPVSTTELLVVHNCTDIHTRQMAVLDVRSATLTPLPATDMIVANTAAAGRRFVAFAGGDANTAPLARVLDTRSKKLVVREEPSAYGYRPVAFESAVPRVVSFQAEDGVTVPAQLFSPVGDGLRPALIFVHGGPQRQMFPAYHYLDYYALAYAFHRRLAELGYLVLSVNYRSGTGYGRTFREAEGRAWRTASEYRDVVAAARWLARRPDVDARRIGIWGGSYGGLLTAQALARNSDLFAAGVAVHGLYDWSWSSPTPFHLNPSRFFGVSAATDARAFDSSPLAAIDRWKSPVLLVCGDTDRNADVLDTVDLVQKLRARHVDVETVLLPGESHGFIRHSSFTRLWRELSAFFAKHL